jgi:hypothetical protein
VTPSCLMNQAIAARVIIGHREHVLFVHHRKIARSTSALGSLASILLEQRYVSYPLIATEKADIDFDGACSHSVSNEGGQSRHGR